MVVGAGVGTVEQAAKNKTAGRMLLRLTAIRLRVARWLAREVELECVIFMGVTIMWVLFLEAGVALFLLVFIVWWTMFHGRSESLGDVTSDSNHSANHDANHPPEGETVTKQNDSDSLK